VIAKLGDFSGIEPDDAPNRLLFPASLVFRGNFLFVTNLSLDLGAALADPSKCTIDSPWAAQVTTFTISRINPPTAPYPRSPLTRDICRRIGPCAESAERRSHLAPPSPLLM